ncbi:cyclopropane-fatty-acyl-phospholipid synthase family protein [Acidiphilium sp. PM]|uniref:SAM-dependent methyltransferase n=1 Tax=Acidiphilium sp. PM TaxID=1043206 RepID=UPI00021459BF|nr:cyclopropane-fatty-acyl-phospholipid synthase family protein [Acidiphilium sp. PM]EGO94708.1 Cyclopropane-fatty-acyl-phospholipid synthase [Acidiphilium sp. PM]
MTDATALSAPPLPRDRRLRLGLGIARMIRVGTLEVVLPDGSVHHFAGAAHGPAATMIVRDARMIARLAFGGSLGLAEAYLDGWWDSPRLIDVLRLGTLNEESWEDMLRGKLWARAASFLAHRLRPNTRRGARRNISEHYDLGNDFYAAWLDPSMTYSAALFAPGQAGLQPAQDAKYHRLCRALGLEPGMRVLEVGCGWGGFAEIAARDYGAHVTAITLSREQLAYARARIAAAGLGGQVEFRLQDYRDVPETFDRIASIEMFEAVGEPFWPAYFAALRDRLAPSGLAALQVITIADRYFEEYRRKADFIQRYVFPGGMLPSPTRLRAEIARAGFALRDAFHFGQDYAETLARWQDAFQSAWPRIARMSPQYDGRFKRLWEFYLAYCEAGFRAGWTDVGQFLIARG